jgi:cyclic lactone autoinducer peptide
MVVNMARMAISCYSGHIYYHSRQNLLKCASAWYTDINKLQGGLAVKKVTQRFGKRLAALTYRVAVKGAGLASNYGWHQPKVPAKLCK